MDFTQPDTGCRFIWLICSAASVFVCSSAGREPGAAINNALLRWRHRERQLYLGAAKQAASPCCHPAASFGERATGGLLAPVPERFCPALSAVYRLASRGVRCIANPTSKRK